MWTNAGVEVERAWRAGRILKNTAFSESADFIYNEMARPSRFGSKRYLDIEGILLTPEVEAALEEAHWEGTLWSWSGSMTTGRRLGTPGRGAAGSQGHYKGLRAWDIKHLAFVSGEHDAPTRKLVEERGMDRHFAQVLPVYKAD